ncbi:bifunctional enoyl-CoA hydratase/phosphate acetyltransferase [Phenylobacterium sp.]|uniref:bifunctional enoyl-CoA hydratase/phosphate acetyltransferase n=1 Tax=Phenylobacterium sp. TaxID=1871053 RepID=UPI0035B05FA1
MATDGRPARPNDHAWYTALLARCDGVTPVATAVVHPCDALSLGAAVEAAQLKLIDPILVGPEAKIRQAAEEAGLDISGYRLEPVAHSHAAAARAVALVREGQAGLVMKGALHTDELMHEVVADDTGLRTERRISHVFLMDVPDFGRPLLITDAAINIAPDLETKRDIVQNAIDLARVMRIEQPKVAILSAVETVNPKLQSTIDAAALCKMADRGQIAGGVLDGPLAFDNAISKEAAAEKGIVSPVAGAADILVAPDLVSGNILAKQLTFIAHADAAGVVLGARIPIILTSRADAERTRIASCAVAVLMSRQDMLAVKPAIR